jgi:hypothetical protein
MRLKFGIISFRVVVEYKNNNQVVYAKLLAYSPSSKEQGTPTLSVLDNYG